MKQLELCGRRAGRTGVAAQHPDVPIG